MSSPFANTNEPVLTVQLEIDSIDAQIARLQQCRADLVSKLGLEEESMRRKLVAAGLTDAAIETAIAVHFGKEKSQTELEPKHRQRRTADECRRT